MSDSTDKDLPGDPRDLPEGDQQLEEYLRGGSAVSRQYRQLRSADVPAELDQRVLRQAKEAAKRRPARSRAWMRWSGPLALAASAVLVLSIVIESGVHDEVSLTAPVSAPAEMKVLRERAEESAERAASEFEAPAGASAQKSAPASAQQSAKESERRVPRDQATAGATGDASVAHIVPVYPASAPSLQFEPVRIEPRAPPPVQVQVPEQPSAQAISAPPPPKVEVPPADLERHAYAKPAPQGNSMESAATTAQKREANTAEHDLSEVAVTGSSTRQRRSAGPRNTVAVPAEPLDNAAAPAEESRSYSEPEQWLQDIRELREQKKHQEADREWRRFRTAYPNYAVDEADPARDSRDQ